MVEFIAMPPRATLTVAFQAGGNDAQGFLSLNLASRGASVTGVDFLDKNIAVCEELSRENPNLEVKFHCDSIEDIIESLKSNRYDLVLGLSVFHHIVYKQGISETKELIEKFLALSNVMIIEVALHDEPLYWADSQPKDPRTLVDSAAFVHEMGRNGTHLSPITRPMYAVSNQTWIFGEFAGHFRESSKNSHALDNDCHAGSRSYFFSDETIVKVYQLDHPAAGHNKSEFERELNFFESPAPGFIVAELVCIGSHAHEAWLVMKRFPGKLLSEVLHEKLDIDFRGVLLGTLKQLTLLEANGSYHNDLRAWNIIISDRGAVYLIDYGAISTSPHDCVWPENIFLSFFVFLREVLTGKIENPIPQRGIFMNPYSLPAVYSNWFLSLLDCHPDAWSFQLFYESLKELSFDGDALPPKVPEKMGEWLDMLERSVFDKITLDQQHISSIEVMVQTKDQELASHAAVFADLDAALQAKDADVLEAQAELQQLQDKIIKDASHVAALETALKAKDADVLEAQTELQRLQDKILEDTNHFKALGDALNAKDADILEAQTDLQRLQDKIEADA